LKLAKTTFMISFQKFFSLCFLLLFSMALSATQNRIDSLSALLKKTTDAGEAANLHNSISFAYIYIDPERALFHAEEALKKAKAAVNEKEIGSAHNNIANYYLASSDFEKAKKHLKEALHAYEAVTYARGIAKVSGNYGLVFYYTGNYSKSLEYLFKSLKAFESLKDEEGMADQYSAIGVIYMENEQLEKALQYDSLALKKYQELGVLDGVALVKGNMANIYTKQGLRSLAMQYYEDAIALFRELGHSFDLGRNLSNLGVEYMDAGDLNRAMELFNEALGIFREVDYEHGISQVLGNLGLCYYKSYKSPPVEQENFVPIKGSGELLVSSAIGYLEEGIAIAERLGIVSSISKLSQELYALHEELGNDRKAFQYLKVYNTAKDSMFSLESKERIEQLTTERELALKEKQIEIDRLEVLKKRNERRYFIAGLALLFVLLLLIWRNFKLQKRANVELELLNGQISEARDSLSEKNHSLAGALQELKETQEQLIDIEKQKENALIRARISQDIHDDISSGLTKISWLTESLKMKQQDEAALPLVAKINSMAKETVSKLGEIIWSSNPERDNLGSLLSFMRQHINQYLEDTPYQYQTDFPEDFPEINISPILRRHLYLVLKEALHNAVKYSEGQHIRIVFKLQGNAYQLVISDDGKGISNTVQGSGYGIPGMKQRIEAVGGEMEIQSQDGKGSTITFRGPLN
jgi:signal transduction histidine kinase/Tfp pilus assembly protein PilF